MKRTKLIRFIILTVGVLTLSGFSGSSELVKENSGNFSYGPWSFMTLNLWHSKDGNAVLITPVFYTKEKPKCTDLMKHAEAHYDQYVLNPGEYCVPKFGYKTEGEANKARDISIASYKKHKYKILYTRFTGY